MCNVCIFSWSRMMPSSVSIVYIARDCSIDADKVTHPSKVYDKNEKKLYL